MMETPLLKIRVSREMGRWFKQYRLKGGYSGRELTKLLQFSYFPVEKGGRYFPAQKLYTLADHLDMPRRELTDMITADFVRRLAEARGESLRYQEETDAQSTEENPPSNQTEAEEE